MSDPFADYGHRATSKSAPRLVGVIKTRSAARDRYVGIIAEMAACKSSAELDDYLASISAEIVQFRAELPLYWNGTGEPFVGLQQEIERAQVRLDDGLDFPRHDPEQKQEEGIGL